jgi:hypothetical protein
MDDVHHPSETRGAAAMTTTTASLKTDSTGTPIETRSTQTHKS